MAINNLVDSVKNTMTTCYLNIDNKIDYIGDYITGKYRSILPKNEIARKITHVAVLVVPGSFLMLGTYFLATEVYGALSKTIKR